MAKFLCAFAVLAVLAVSANALKCYECPLGCQGEDKSKWNMQDCGANPAGAAKVCLRQVIEIKDSPTRVVRKCAIQNEGKKYECVSAPGEKTSSCEVCSTDLCNSAGSITLSTLAIASIVLPFLATRLY